MNSCLIGKEKQEQDLYYELLNTLFYQSDL